jgi:DegT/DnrJ/EryC1/StrS aminotransferase family
VDIVPFVDLAAHHAPIREEIRAAVDRVLVHGKYILGPEVEAFEQGFAAMVGAKYGIGVSSGLDALRLAFEAVGPATRSSSPATRSSRPHLPYRRSARCRSWWIAIRTPTTSTSS